MRNAMAGILVVMILFGIGFLFANNPSVEKTGMGSTLVTKGDVNWAKQQLSAGQVVYKSADKNSLYTTDAPNIQTTQYYSKFQIVGDKVKRVDYGPIDGAVGPNAAYSGSSTDIPNDFLNRDAKVPDGINRDWAWNDYSSIKFSADDYFKVAEVKPATVVNAPVVIVPPSVVPAPTSGTAKITYPDESGNNVEVATIDYSTRKQITRPVVTDTATRDEVLNMVKITTQDGKEGWIAVDSNGNLFLDKAKNGDYMPVIYANLHGMSYDSEVNAYEMGLPSNFNGNANPQTYVIVSAQGTAHAPSKETADTAAANTLVTAVPIPPTTVVGGVKLDDVTSGKIGVGQQVQLADGNTYLVSGLGLFPVENGVASSTVISNQQLALIAQKEKNPTEVAALGGTPSTTQYTTYSMGLQPYTLPGNIVDAHPVYDSKNQLIGYGRELQSKDNNIYDMYGNVIGSMKDGNVEITKQGILPIGEYPLSLLGPTPTVSGTSIPSSVSPSAAAPSPSPTGTPSSGSNVINLLPEIQTKVGQQIDFGGIPVVITKIGATDKGITTVETSLGQPMYVSGNTITLGNMQKNIYQDGTSVITTTFPDKVARVTQVSTDNTKIDVKYDKDGKTAQAVMSFVGSDQKINLPPGTFDQISAIMNGRINAKQNTYLDSMGRELAALNPSDVKVVDGKIVATADGKTYTSQYDGNTFIFTGKDGVTRTYNPNGLSLMQGGQKVDVDSETALSIAGKGIKSLSVDGLKADQTQTITLLNDEKITVTRRPINDQNTDFAYLTTFYAAGGQKVKTIDSQTTDGVNKKVVTNYVNGKPNDEQYYLKDTTSGTQVTMDQQTWNSYHNLKDDTTKKAYADQNQVITDKEVLTAYDQIKATFGEDAAKKAMFSPFVWGDGHVDTVRPFIVTLDDGTKVTLRLNSDATKQSLIRDYSNGDQSVVHFTNNNQIDYSTLTQGDSYYKYNGDITTLLQNGKIQLGDQAIEFSKTIKGTDLSVQGTLTKDGIVDPKVVDSNGEPAKDADGNEILLTKTTDKQGNTVYLDDSGNVVVGPQDVINGLNGLTKQAQDLVDQKNKEAAAKKQSTQTPLLQSTQYKPVDSFPIMIGGTTVKMQRQFDSSVGGIIDVYNSPDGKKYYKSGDTLNWWNGNSWVPVDLTNSYNKNLFGAIRAGEYNVQTDMLTSVFKVKPDDYMVWSDGKSAKIGRSNYELKSDGVYEDGKLLDPNDPKAKAFKALLDQEALNAKSVQEGYKVRVIDDTIRDKAAYDAVWGLTNLLLENFAFPAVDKMCQQDWTASEPSTKPVDTHTGGGSGGTGGPGGQIGPIATAPVAEQDNISGGGSGAPGGVLSCPSDTYTAQLELNGYLHMIIYTIRACSGRMDYNVYLNSARGQTEQIDSDTISPGTTITYPYNVTRNPTFDSVCISLTGHTTRCFPAVNYTE